jgi:hypothetical protein
MAGRIFSKLKEFFKPTVDIQVSQVGPWAVGQDRVVVYSPFPTQTDGTRNLGISWEENNKKFDKYTVIRHGDLPRALSFVKDSQGVFIVCHCSALATHVEDNVRPRPNKLTAAELAERIEKDGLSKGHRRIKLWACSGAAGGLDSFANELARKLLLRGYYSLELYAYLSTVCSLDPNTRQKSALALDRNGHPINGKLVRARDMRVQFC